MISLRKINVLLTIIAILMLLNHAVLLVLYFYGFISYSPSFYMTGRNLFYPVVAHIIISLYLHFKDTSRGVNRYHNLNSETNQQFITGILMIIFITLHIMGYSSYHLVELNTFYSVIYHFTVDALMFTSIVTHLRVSIPKLMISLGFLGKKEAYHNFKKWTNWASLIILIVLILGEVIYYMGGFSW